MFFSSSKNIKENLTNNIDDSMSVYLVSFLKYFWIFLIFSWFNDYLCLILEFTFIKKISKISRFISREFQIFIRS